MTSLTHFGSSHPKADRENLKVFLNNTVFTPSSIPTVCAHPCTSHSLFPKEDYIEHLTTILLNAKTPSYGVEKSYSCRKMPHYFLNNTILSSLDGSHGISNQRFTHTCAWTYQFQRHKNKNNLSQDIHKDCEVCIDWVNGQNHLIWSNEEFRNNWCLFFALKLSVNVLKHRHSKSKLETFHLQEDFKLINLPQIDFEKLMELQEKAWEEVKKNQIRASKNLGGPLLINSSDPNEIAENIHLESPQQQLRTNPTATIHGQLHPAKPRPSSSTSTESRVQNESWKVSWNGRKGSSKSGYIPLPNVVRMSTMKRKKKPKKRKKKKNFLFNNNISSPSREGRGSIPVTSTKDEWQELVSIYSGAESNKIEGLYSGNRFKTQLAEDQSRKNRKIVDVAQPENYGKYPLRNLNNLKNWRDLGIGQKRSLEVDSYLHSVSTAAFVVTRAARRYLNKKRRKRIHESIIIIQSAARGYIDNTENPENIVVRRRHKQIDFTTDIQLPKKKLKTKSVYRKKSMRVDSAWITNYIESRMGLLGEIKDLPDELTRLATDRG